MVIRGKNALLFCGMLSECATLSRHINQIDVTPWGSPERQYIEGGPEDVTLSLLLFGKDVGQVLDAWNSWPNHNMIMLGMGHICPYCGSYNVAGGVKCWHCGGNTEEQDFAKIEQFPFVFTSIEVDSSYEGVHKMSVDMMLLESERCDLNMLVGGLSIEGLPSNYRLNPDLHVCQYCGRTIEKGDSCPSCGGNRIPWQEVVKMDDRNCAYCGRQTAGIVCQGCGQTLAATSYARMKEGMAA